MSRSPRHHFPPPTLITTTEDLAAVCDRLRRRATSSPSTPSSCASAPTGRSCASCSSPARTRSRVIDALAPGLDLAPLGELLADQAVMKVFHAARQDIEIFVLKFGDVPRPLFDTQVAAMVAGFGDQVGYEALVGGAHRRVDRQGAPVQRLGGAPAVAGADRLCRRRRHLSARGLPQAARPAGARTAGSTGWPRRWRCWPTPPPTAPTRRRCGSGCARAASNRRFLGMLRALAAWREREAQRVNIPRQRLLQGRDAAGDRRDRAGHAPRRWPAPAA